jgi:hypothetical protein
MNRSRRAVLSALAGLFAELRLAWAVEELLERRVQALQRRLNGIRERRERTADVLVMVAGMLRDHEGRD